ncbi:sphingomyelin phosphodiesterase 2-like [Ornithodoros turicata]|uniref:sphingomyelin phosphodiesterase 2-like n=1 Tax=Ornithodoros turicata TaxID=34597 RepID=UPI0031399488
MRMEIEVKVFTLNCWGIPVISKHRHERMATIASYLAVSDFDFVFLQELWSQEDFNTVHSKTSHNLPYAHYFHSGVLGSGVCILSKSPIIDTGMLKYTLNGYAHKFYHGDWFGGKVVGLCKVIHRGLSFNLYVTHLHAEYNRQWDVYLSHRISQSFELSQYVKLTSDMCDVAILAGDLNTEPLDPPYNIILHNTNLEDAFVAQDLGPDMFCMGATCGHPDNYYTSKAEKNDCPTGKRIDYVMFKVGKGVVANCKVCRNPTEKTPSGLPLSDHEAVEVTLKVGKSSEVGTPVSCGSISPSKLVGTCTPALVDALHRGQEQLGRSLDGLYLDKLFYVLAGCFITCVLAGTMPIQLSLAYQWILVLIRTFAAMSLGFCFMMGFFWNAMERSSLLSARKSMRLLYDAFVKEVANYGGYPLNETPTGKLIEQGDLRV